MGEVDRGALFEQWKPYAAKMAMDMAKRSGIDADDLFQAALTGLHNATGTFDQDKGTFPTHALWSIRTEFSKITGESNRARKLETVLDAPVGDGEFALIDTLVAETEDPTDAIFLSEARPAIAKAMKSLTQRELEVIIARFFVGESTSDLANVYGSSKQAISSCEKRALEKLKRPLMAFGKGISQTGQTIPAS